ncbi:TPA: hypothetical protein MFN02_004867 [Klebsiella pneumoniae]|nr:hypothetical protein [Klebsiella pneumoniae]
MLRLIRAFQRWNCLHNWRRWWQDDAFFRRKHALLTADLFSFEQRYHFLRLMVSAEQQRGKL